MKKNNLTKAVPQSFCLNQEAMDQFKLYCKRQGKSVSAVIAEVIIILLAREEQ